MRQGLRWRRQSRQGRQGAGAMGVEVTVNPSVFRNKMVEPIVHHSNRVSATRGSVKKLEKGSKDGLSWESIYCEELAPVDSWRRLENCVYLSWIFEWDETNMGIYGFDVNIAVWCCKHESTNTPFRINMKIVKSGDGIVNRMGTTDEVAWSTSCSDRFFQYELTLNEITKPDDDVYQDHELNDAILVVQGVKINVNMNNLAMRSDYFNTLFNSEFKENSMDEIPINDVKYQEFITFINTIHPTNPEPATDENVEILLELADRFMMPAVTRQAEQHLLISTDFSIEDVLKMSDQYKLDKLLNKCLGMFSTVEHIKLFKNCSDHFELSDSIKSKLFDIIMKILK